VLFEGAQGTFLDLDYGTYPFVTSSHPVAAGACLGTGIGPLDLDNVIGVAKAYTTRVGAGPFPAEAAEDEAQRLRELGREYGTTTGRPRRCGWFDACMVRTAVRLNSVSSLAVTKFDVLDSYEVIKMVTGYEIDSEMIDYVPSDPEVYVRCRPVVEEIAGWCKPTGEARKPSDLPGEARAYLEAIAAQVEAPIAVVSVGPDRGSTVWYD
jgi:adenylosuccinate synthase